MPDKNKQDRFADIAAGGIGGDASQLTDPVPAAHNRDVCTLTQESGTATSYEKKIATEAELRPLLDRLRRKMEPFLADHTAPVETERRRYELCDIKKDGEPVTLPDYGGPVGAAKAEYTGVFHLDCTPEREKDAWYLHFDGVDYMAAVYVGTECVGTHEGFFSPFEFDVTDVLRRGDNKIRVTVCNDYIYGGNDEDQGGNIEGDKLYAATGLGWDDPEMGWHHCPPGMGIWGRVYLERRPAIFLSDLSVRPLPEEGVCEVVAEVTKRGYGADSIRLAYEILPKNFCDPNAYRGEYEPATELTVGRGDSFTEAAVGDRLGQKIELSLQHGENIYRFRVPMPHHKTWSPDEPYLYEARVSVICGETATDRAASAFGMRTFRQDTESDPKGMFYLNGEKIRLRGANTMGFEQRDVQEGNYAQLIDDILLARLCNMNFLRITQRPVQREVYDYCDRLGMLIQTDLPLFGRMRRTRFAEGVRQAREMERLIRPHACCILVTYINEPFPNAANEPHRHLNRRELEAFFAACDTVIRLENPDRVTKHVDGDYDPPCASMPDNHCYPAWYNGHGIDIGRLHRGYWLSVRPGWYYGCGEYGAEGLDSADVMDRFYPESWLTEPFDPGRIRRSQTGPFGAFFYDRQDSREGWIEESQRYQALATTMMTEAFRRDDRMISNAIHLFIDAWPAGWMKAIVDCGRHPKQAYFAYRNALEPIHVSLRTDRFTVYCGEKINVEAWLCNDTNERKNITVRFEMFRGDTLYAHGEKAAVLEACRAAYACETDVAAPEVADREPFLFRALLLDEDGSVLTYAEQTVEVFRHVEIPQNDRVTLICDLPVGNMTADGCEITVKDCSMLPLHFVSRKTGHPAAAEFRPNDFRYWYSAAQDCIAPIISRTFTAPGFTPILLANNTDDQGRWGMAMAAAEHINESGHKTVLCCVDLRTENPIAERFLANLYKNF